MLVVQMFTKLILLCLRATSDLHATFAMANHSLHTELAAPTLPKKMERAGPDLAQSESHQPHPPTHLLMLGLRPCVGEIGEDPDYIFVDMYRYMCSVFFVPFFSDSWETQGVCEQLPGKCNATWRSALPPHQ